MKRSLRWGLLLTVGVPLTFSACNKDDDPEPDPIVATWKVDVYQMTEVPANFSKWNNLLFTGLYGEDNLTLTIKDDKTYTRLFELLGPDQTESGTWTKEGTTLTLKSNDTDFGEESFNIESELTATSSSMVLSTVEKVSLLPDAILEEYDNDISTIPDDTIAKYQQSVDVTILHSYDKVTNP